VIGGAGSAIGCTETIENDRFPLSPRNWMLVVSSRNRDRSGRLRHHRSGSDTRGACGIDAWFVALVIE
jgi:hypothetical protein